MWVHVAGGRLFWSDRDRGWEGYSEHQSNAKPKPSSRIGDGASQQYIKINQGSVSQPAVPVDQDTYDPTLDDWEDGCWDDEDDWCEDDDDWEEPPFYPDRRYIHVVVYP